MSSESQEFAAFDAAIGQLAGRNVYRAGPSDFVAAGRGPRLPRAGWAAQIVLSLALERALLEPAARRGGLAAAPAELPVYGAFAYALAQGFRHAEWAQRQGVTLDAVVAQALAQHAILLGVGPSLSLPALAHTRYRAMRRRAVDRPPMRDALRGAADAFVTWVLEPTEGATHWLTVLYRAFCAHVGVSPLLAEEPPLGAPPADLVGAPAGQPAVPSTVSRSAAVRLPGNAPRGPRA